MINDLTDFIKTLWYKIFTLSESKAIKIAGHYTGLKADNSWKIYPCAQNNWYVYNLDSLKSCWFIICPWGDGLDGMMLRSSRIVCVSKNNGKILSGNGGHPLDYWFTNNFMYDIQIIY